MSASTGTRTVLDAAAVGIPDEHYGEEIMVCCTLKQGTACTVDQLREYCLKNLGKYKTPKVIKLLDYLPKGPSGKIQRLRLPALVNELIVKNSSNIVPEQIDEVVCEHPEVIDAASTGIPDERCGQDILLCCTLKPGSSCTERDLRDFCADRLGEIKTPKIVKVVQMLPRNASGMIERARLSELLND